MDGEEVFLGLKKKVVGVKDVIFDKCWWFIVVLDGEVLMKRF